MALPNGLVCNQELLHAQTHIWNHIFSYTNSVTLKCTTQLGIPDIIHKHGKPMLLSELTEALSVDEAKIECVQRLMRIMVHSNFFIMAKISEEDEKEGYWLTPASVLLLKGQSFSMAPFVVETLNPVLMDPWNHLSEWFKTNHSMPFFTTHGVTPWEYIEQTPGVNQSFNEAMASDSRLVSKIINEDCWHVFQGLSSVVDVGGGTGIMAKAIVNAFPGIKCMVLELPHVVAASGGIINDGLTFIAGNMFEHIPSADAIFMKCVLHDWPDEKCVAILKKCKQAIPSKEKGGKVIIVDMVVDYQQDHALVETQLFFDMEMMIVSGKERTEKDWANLFLDAGFTSYNITNVLGSRSLIEVFP